MEPSFVLWPENSTTRQDQIQQTPPRTRSKKASKPPAPKRAPQRGLGVAQLERLRVEERFKEVVPPQTQRSLMASYSPGNGLPGLYQIEQGYNMVRYEGAYGYRTGTGYVVPGAVPMPVPEPPSSQMVVRPSHQLLSVPHVDLDPVRCYSDQCEFCVRKKRLFGESSVYHTNGVDYMRMDLPSITAVDQEGDFLPCMEKRRSTPLMVQRQTKEYQFFPMYNGDQSELAYPTSGTSSTSSSSSPSAYPSSLIDLSLKL